MRRSASKSRSVSMPDIHSADTSNQYTNMLPDIYVIGLQELVKLDSKHAMSDKEGLHRQAEWEAWLLRVINSSALVNRAVEKRRTLNGRRRDSNGKGSSFKLLEKRMLMGLLLLVFVKNGVDVELMASAQTAAGILGVVGNKGAVGVALKHQGHRMVFVCAHLAAGRAKTKERNQNVSKIMECMSLKTKDGDLKVHDFENRFFFGDLNYRISKMLSKDAIFHRIGKGDLVSLYVVYLCLSISLSLYQTQNKNVIFIHRGAADQLTISRAKGEVFQGYREGAINFLPTYKYIPGGGAGAWDCAEDGKKRAPAYCDRILWYHHRDVVQLSYTSTPEVCICKMHSV